MEIKVSGDLNFCTGFFFFKPNGDWYYGDRQRLVLLFPSLLSSESRSLEELSELGMVHSVLIAESELGPVREEIKGGENNWYKNQKG